MNALLNQDFARITYTQAIEHLKNAKTQFAYPVDWGCDLQTEHERYLTEEVYKGPVFVTDYPKEIKSFYNAPKRRRQNGGGYGLIASRRGRDHRRQPKGGT